MIDKLPPQIPVSNPRCIRCARPQGEQKRRRARVESEPLRRALGPRLGSHARILVPLTFAMACMPPEARGHRFYRYAASDA